MSIEEFKRRRDAEIAGITDEEEAEEKCFSKNAFLFYSATERILVDENLCHIRVPMNNNLAYIGTSGLRDATLGVYVKWWQTYKKALFFARTSWFKKTTEPRLVYFIAGSPLSGRNHCSAVNSDGIEYHGVHLSPFFDAWHSFRDINKSYPEELKKSHRGKRTLREAAEILSADPDVMAHYEQVMHNLDVGIPYEVKSCKKSNQETSMN